ncbi:hypothetical protein LTR56_005112 [Elasticomyces elasticus]|nr:hypothetical protein LTR22_022003 [Elasticomyces elasticus]KAK3652402.1 hypothetical protein LTR56_005112 [Elasticomyces elasticus]KAK4921270.1 hypothetical protein LTR49_011273 [Elasticomyces elasticus]KAK5759718.1 hypothetical protein LTS12_010235 [Elasticomyces elasticus]
MLKRSAQKSGPSRTETWLKSIPMSSFESLEQLQSTNTATVPLPSATDSSDPALAVALPVSRSDSTSRKTGTLQGGSSTSTNARTGANNGIASQIPLPASNTTLSDRDVHVGALPASNTSSLYRPTSVRSLWQLEHAGLRTETQVALPSSSITSGHAPSTRNGTASSQAVGGAADSTSLISQAVPEATPVHIDVVDGEQVVEGHPVAPAHGRKLNYWEKIAPLMECLPHLRRLNPDMGRHRNVGRITCVDYSSTPGQQAESRDISSDQFSKRKDFLVAVQDLIEDLASDLIEALGTTFSIDPELFVEHLNRAAYDVVDYADDLPWSWETHGMPKAYASLKWYRPVYQNRKVHDWLRTPSDLLGRIDTNLGSAPASITWADTQIDDEGKLRKEMFDHGAVVDTNIFRQSWPLSTRPFQTIETQRQSGQSTGPVSRSQNTAAPMQSLDNDPSSEAEADENWRRSAITTAWEEKIGCFVYRQASCPIVVLLLDPLPAISDHRTPLRRRKTPITTRSARGLRQLVELALPVVPRTFLSFPANKFEATAEDIARLKHSISTLHSTRASVVSRLGNTEPLDWQAFRADPLEALLHVVQADIRAFLEALDSTLNEISQDSLDDYLMTRRLPEWRKLMSDFEIQVPAIGKSVHGFVDFVFGAAKAPDKVQRIAGAIDNDVARAKLRLDEAYTALRADMQFTESRRSILEAQTVTKLTELAFLFIPLSFSASLFSIQVKELENGVPVWTFVVTAIAMALLSYGIRLLLASDFLADSSRGALERFWARHNVRRGENAPWPTLVTLTVQEVWRNGGSSFAAACSYVLFVSAFVVVPVAFLWKSTRLDTGFNVAMTLFLLASALATLWFVTLVGGSNVGERVTGWFNRHDMEGSDYSSQEAV